MTICSIPAGAATFTVTNLNNSNLGSLRQAILNANAAPGSDTIVFQTGLSGTILLTSGVMEITGNLTFNGPGANVLAISGNHASPIFSVKSSATVTINGMTIKDSDGECIDHYGGGAVCNSGILTISNSVLSNNSNYGGAGGEGGAIFNRGTLEIINSVLFSNTSHGSGGAIYNDSGTLTIRNSILSQNYTGADGAAFVNKSGTATIINSTLNDNLAHGARACHQLKGI